MISNNIIIKISNRVKIINKLIWVSLANLMILFTGVFIK